MLPTVSDLAFFVCNKCLSTRLVQVSSQSADTARKLIETHLTLAAAKIPGAVLEITRNPFSGSPFKTSKDTPGNTVVAAVLRNLFGREPVGMGMGGSIPVFTHLREVLSVETTMLAFGHSDENVHAPDEFGRIDSFRTGEKAYVRLFQGLADAHATSRQGKVEL